ncbi:MAG: AbrB/MazE/SpoVT family DNA-binding domain-containing protein [Solobacterium sp.]|jgi:AbrB family looped-hinge helix DNA binding protein|nr:AbrB/MazE/SpoVT family DNA-binding domain-containing protein [Solobacterium sp.]
MSEINIVSDAKVMPKGQVTIPKKIRDILGVSNGDRVTFVVENGEVKVINSAIYALKRFQAQMAGEGKKAGLLSDEAIAEWITSSRREENNA